MRAWNLVAPTVDYVGLSKEEHLMYFVLKCAPLVNEKGEALIRRCSENVQCYELFSIHTR